MKKSIFIISISLHFLLAACSTTQTNTPEDDDRVVTMISGNRVINEPIIKTDQITTTGTIQNTITLPPSLFTYMTYSDALFNDSIRSGRQVVLFFHASWCPTCKVLDEYIDSHLSEIPDNSIILKVDYDSSDELKKKYTVTTQHTTIVLDKDGNTKLKKLGARTIGTIFTP